MQDITFIYPHYTTNLDHDHTNQLYLKIVEKNSAPLRALPSISFFQFHLLQTTIAYKSIIEQLRAN